MTHLLTTFALLGVALAAGDSRPLNPPLDAYVQARIAEFETIPLDRQRQLTGLAEYVRGRVAAGEPARLTFICTHNSRRSQLAQIWAAAAAARYGVSPVETFSGGTEATAFNPRAIAALRRAGFDITVEDGGNNPRYQVRFSKGVSPLVCFSKIYSTAGNPQRNFCAVMTCSDADQNCPVVQGAARRIALPYDDPKSADGTEQESATYDARCQQIAREMLFVFEQVRSKSAVPQRSKLAR